MRKVTIAATILVAICSSSVLANEGQRRMLAGIWDEQCDNGFRHILTLSYNNRSSATSQVGRHIGDGTWKINNSQLIRNLAGQPYTNWQVTSLNSNHYQVTELSGSGIRCSASRLKTTANHPVANPNYVNHRPVTPDNYPTQNPDYGLVTPDNTPPPNPDYGLVTPDNRPNHRPHHKPAHPVVKPGYVPAPPVADLPSHDDGYGLVTPDNTPPAHGPSYEVVRPGYVATPPVAPVPSYDDPYGLVTPDNMPR